MNSTECIQTPSKQKHQPNITFTPIAEIYEVKTPNVSNEAATSFTPVLSENYDEIMNSTESSAIISKHTNKIPDIIVTPIQETYEQGSLLELPTSPPIKSAECLIQSENNLPSYTAFLTPPPKTRNRLRKPVGDLPRSADSTLLSTRIRNRLAHSPLRRSSPQRLRRLPIRMSGVHKIGTHGNHKLHYKSNFTIMHNLPASTTTLKEAQRLSSMNAQILDYRCDLLDVKPPGLGGNTISDLLSSSLVRSSNPIKKMFTEVNKYRINSTTAKEFMNTVGIHCLKGKMERTNLRALMDDVNCEPDYLLAIVNTGSNLNMIVTPNRPAPFILEGFDIELCTGTMIMVEPKLLTDYKFMVPSQGSKDDEICLLFFFHKDEATWVKEEPQGRDESISLVSKGTLQTSSTISKLSPEEKSSKEKVEVGESADYEDKHEDTAEKYSKNTSDTDTKCSVETENKAKTIIKSTPTAESTNSKSASETDPNPKASFPTNSESMPRREFVHKDLYEEAINLKNKKELNKLLKLCNLKATGSVHDFRNRLLEYIQTSLANNTTISKEVVQELLSSLNMKGLNSEMKRLELPVKGTVADKREALLGAFCGTGLPLGGNPNPTEATQIQNLSIHNELNPTSDRCRDIEREKNEDKRLKILEESMINIQREFDAQKATINLLMASKTNKHISECNSQPPPEVGSGSLTCSQHCETKWIQLQEQLASIKTELGETNKHISECNSQPPPEVGSGSLTCSQHCEAKWIQLQEQLASIKTELGETITMNKNGQDVMIQYTPDLQRNQTFPMNTIYAHSMQIHCLQSKIQNVTGNRRSYDTILREHNYCQRSLDINNSKPPKHKGMPAADQQDENVGYNPNNLIPAERLPFHTEYVVETNNAQYKPIRSTTHSRTQYDKPGSDKGKHRLKKKEVTKERIVDGEVDAGPSYASKLTDCVEASRENIAEQEWQTVTYRKNSQKATTGNTNKINGTKECKAYQPKQNINSQHRCVLIYDDYYDNFRNDYFTRLFEVEKYKIKTVFEETFIPDEATRKRIKECDIVYLHIGSKDIYNGKNGESVRDTVRKIVAILVKNTKARICISTPIRSMTNKDTDAKLKKLEDTVYDLATCTEEYRSRLYVSNLYSIGTFATQKHSSSLSLSERGKMRLYIKMRDSLLSSLRYKTTSNVSMNKSYRRKSPNNE